MISLDAISMAASGLKLTRAVTPLFKIVEDEDGSPTEYVAAISDRCWMGLSTGKIMTESHRWMLEEAVPTTRILLSLMKGPGSDIIRSRWTHFKPLRSLFTEHVSHHGGEDLSRPTFVEKEIRHAKYVEKVPSLYSTFDDTMKELEKMSTSKEIR